jgi:hypothetical protein
MQIKVSELKKIVKEAVQLQLERDDGKQQGFTEHQLRLIKNSMQQAMGGGNKLVRLLKHDEGNRNEVITAFAAATRDAKGWVPMMCRYYPHKAEDAKKYMSLIEELEKIANTPFGGLFKGKNAEKADRLTKELNDLCAQSFKTVYYDENYKNFSDRTFDPKLDSTTEKS